MTWARSLGERREQRAVEKARNMEALCQPSRSIHRGVYEGEDGEPAPKSEAYRDPALLAMAERKPCLLQVKGVCNGRTDTTVACHSNQSIHGKAGARKADDCYSVWGCAACHAWLDQGQAMASHKDAVFRYALARQVECWRLIACGREPKRFRMAADRALEALRAKRKQLEETA